ncbi:MAG: PaaI family thioesterase [Candidatus Omnitrophota bacterium]
MEEIRTPYEKLLKMYYVERKEGFCKIGLAYRKELTNPHGLYHGGTISSLIDTAAVHGLRTKYRPGPYFTVNLNVRFKNSSKASEIFAEARPSHLKGKFFKTEVKVIDKDTNLIAEAEVKSFLPKWRGIGLTLK